MVVRMVKTISAAVLISLALLGQTSSDGGQRSAQTPMKDLLGEPGMEWNTFLAIQAAAAEASRQGVKIESCRIKAAEQGEALFVMFSNPDPTHHWMGCPPGPCQCFDVELAKSGLRVLNAHFSK